MPIERHQSPLERTQGQQQQQDQTSTMPNTDAEKVVDGFPHLTVSPINDVPNYESISLLNLQLNVNAASVQSNLGDGLLGLLYLTMTPVEYNALSVTKFFPPENPDAAPTVPYATTDSQVATLVQ
jgi:hypothetical protein